MSLYSQYPNLIDTTTQLPLATDNVTAVKSEIFNRHQDAILAIETELGVLPAGTFGTIRARSDNFDSRLTTIETEAKTESGSTGTSDIYANRPTASAGNVSKSFFATDRNAGSGQLYVCVKLADGVTFMWLPIATGAISVVAANANFVASFGNYYLTDASAGGFVVTLPDGTTAENGASVTIQFVASGSISVISQGSQSILGQTSISTPGQRVVYTWLGLTFGWGAAT